MGPKKTNEVLRRLIPICLILFFVTFSIVSWSSMNSLQGDARVVNYAGIVRGATQRLVKQELNQVQNDDLIQYLDDILKGLRDGCSMNNLTQLADPHFQSLVQEMMGSWSELKDEITYVRQGGDAGKLYDLSEDYFNLANATVSAAEFYSEKKVWTAKVWLFCLDLILIFFILLFWFYRKQRERMSDKLVAAERASREKGDFLSRMSHEIRTPMNGIVGMTEIAQLSLEDPRKVADCLNKIKLSSQYMVSLVNDILDMSRIESGKVELYQKAFELNAFAERLRTMFSQKAQEEEIDFSVRMKDITVSHVVGDELRLSQVIVNIISNAIKFTPAQGRVEVVIAQTDIKEQSVELQISVTDTGIGMSKEFLGRIFEPFEQAEGSSTYGGTGLGLAISHSLIRMMNGNITIESKKMEGTRFNVKLTLLQAVSGPLSSSDTISADPSNALRIGDLSGVNILLVEDNEINSEIVATMLESKNATVDTAWNGREAVEKFLQNDTGPYDLILMDTQMPEMDGLEACHAIRTSRHLQAKSIPIIGLSANAFQQDVDRALACGMNAYLSKPVEMDRLLSTISTVIS